MRSCAPTARSPATRPNGSASSACARGWLRVGLADEYLTADSVIGPVYVAFNGRGLSATAAATGDGAADAFEAAFAARFKRSIRPAARPDPELRRSVERALLEGHGRGTRLDLRGLSPFALDVLATARRIPRGEVRPYGWVAGEIGRPAAMRAVGTALGHNPMPLLIPCHRVVRTDGLIGSYAWGSGVKRALLAAEGLDPEALERRSRAGEHLVGSASTHVVCWPTCRHVRRIGERNRVPFRSLAVARASGYRPCRDCRPT